MLSLLSWEMISNIFEGTHTESIEPSHRHLLSLHFISFPIECNRRAAADTRLQQKEMWGKLLLILKTGKLLLYSKINTARQNEETPNNKFCKFSLRLCVTGSIVVRREISQERVRVQRLLRLTVDTAGIAEWHDMKKFNLNSSILNLCQRICTQAISFDVY